MNRVVLTGIGLVTPLGLGREATWKNLINSGSAVKPYQNNPGFLCARVDNLPVPSEVRLVSLAFLAANDAIKDSGLNVSAERMGCTVSVSKPNLASSCQDKLNFSEIFLQSTVGEQLYRIFKLRGPLQNIVAACATGTNSIIVASEWIKHGICDVALAGACESSLDPLYMSGFKKMGVLADEKVCPFDKNRQGFAIGEGAGIVVLENKQKALFRGARIYAEILGWAMSNDTHNPVSFNSNGKTISEAINRTLRSSGIDKVDYINAHGTATQLNDIIETKAIKQSFKGNARDISISSTKAATGHLLGASGSVELAFSVMALRDQVVPPTLNLSDQDPECDLDYTPNKSRNRMIQNVMSLSFGFGGQIGVILAGR